MALAKSKCEVLYVTFSVAVNIDDCVNVNCGNGHCMDLVAGYECDCNPGYSGDHCQSTSRLCSPH